MSTKRTSHPALAELGMVPDSVIATQLGTTRQNVAKMRLRRGIPARWSARQQQRPGERKTADGIVYFIQCGEFIKIGFTSRSPVLRLNELDCGPVGMRILATLANRTEEHEGNLHRRFGHLRLKRRGDWFRSAPDLLAFIDGFATPWTNQSAPAAARAA